MNFKTIIINLCKKILSVSGSIILLSLLVFYVARLAPGDPLVSFYGDRAENMSPAMDIAVCCSAFTMLIIPSISPITHNIMEI